MWRLFSRWERPSQWALVVADPVQLTKFSVVPAAQGEAGSLFLVSSKSCLSVSFPDRPF